MRILRWIMPRSGFRTFLLILVGFYLFLVFSFHAGLQGSDDRNGVREPRGRRHEDRQKMFEDFRQNDLDNSLKSKDDIAAEGSKLYPKKVDHFDQEAPLDLFKKKEVKAVNRNPGTTSKPRVFSPEKPARGPGVPCIGDEVEEFVFRPLANDVVLFSGYWDERPNDFDNQHNGTYIRIMAVVRRGAKPELNCVFPSQLVHAKEQTTSVSYYEMCENHGRPWGAYILSCKVPDVITSSMCSVTLKAPSNSWLGNDAPPEAAVTIRRLKPTGQPSNFATCVPPLFGKVDQYQLTEFIELTKALGSQHITFYDYNVQESTRAVLDKYESEGLISVIPWTLPAHINSGMWYYGQLLSIQDCLYRNMHSSYYVSFNDIDEYMVPHASDLYDWTDMVRHLSAPKRVGFSFISAFFDPYQTGGLGKNIKYENFTALSSLQRTSSFSNIRTKCMVQPYQIFEKGIHHVSKPIFADLQITKIDPADAFLHHYRKCVANFGMDCGSYMEDTSILRFADLVYAGTEETMMTLQRGPS